jgi:2-oxoglutarate ferredoxin oxidoreductase subunit alpha
MPELVIADASCFIALSRTGGLWLLKELYGTVITTSTVRDEFGSPPLVSGEEPSKLLRTEECLLEVSTSGDPLRRGDSGDGIPAPTRTGEEPSSPTSNALFGNDVSTFPNFPAEIRAPQGTLAGVSGYQLHFGSVERLHPGDQCDVLVVMNAAALKANLAKLKLGGTIIANSDGFDAKNLRLAGYIDEEDPLTDGTLDNYVLHTVDVTKMTRNALEGTTLGMKEKDRCKNMFVLGFINWMYSRSLEQREAFLEGKFGKKPELLEANLKVLLAGYNYGDTSETFTTRFEVKPAPMPKGNYRSITGNQGTALGLIAAAQKAGLELFYGSYPITPASDILHELAKHKNFGVKTFQAEDEIAAICSAIGASYGGALGVTASSGPGIALKGEAMGLAFMLEIPLVIVNVQRGGPSTGCPPRPNKPTCGKPCTAATAKRRSRDRRKQPHGLFRDGLRGRKASPWST